MKNVTKLITKRVVQSTGYVALIGLLVLPGCDIFKSSGASKDAFDSSIYVENDGSQVLVHIGGKPAVTEKNFENFYDQMIASNPQLQQLIQFMPHIKRNILDGMVHEKIVLLYAEKNGLHEQESYKSELQQAIRAAKVNLAAKHFEKNMIGTVEVEDTELHKFYDEQKDPRLLVTKGGIKASGVEFSTKEAAQSFLEKAKNSPKNLKAVAGSAKVTEFIPVSDFSVDIDKKVKEKVLDISKFPTVIMVEGSDKKFWVVSATGKQENQYKPFDEVKDQLKQVVQQQKAQTVFAEKMDELRKEYNVEVNEDAFKKDAEPTPKMESESEDIAESGHVHEAGERPVDDADMVSDDVQAQPIKAL